MDYFASPTFCAWWDQFYASKMPCEMADFQWDEDAGVELLHQLFIAGITPQQAISLAHEWLYDYLGDMSCHP